MFYNAGTDCLRGDPLGGLSISASSIVKRDETVFRHCLRAKPQPVPVVMVLSGGYQRNNAAVIADSVLNLDDKFALFQGGAGGSLAGAGAGAGAGEVV